MMTIMRSNRDPYRGRTVGNVELQEPLGQGGMGMVYKGHHRSLDRTVAVKLLPQRHDDKADQFRHRFLREGRTAARIHHDNVVQVMDSGTEDDLAYLVMEFVEGSNIGALMDRDGALAEDLVTRLALDMVAGLQAIHAQGVIHRDLKPDNLLLTRRGRVKIADLGLARRLDDPELNRLTATGMVVGTPLYVAPETIRDVKHGGPPSDIYGLGATLYHMLCGQPPFDGANPYDVMRGHLERVPRAVHEIRPEISRRTSDLVMSCLAKDPDRRPSLADMATVLSNRGTLRHTGPGILVGMAVTVVLSVAAIAILGWHLLQRQPNTEILDPATAGHVHLDLAVPVEVSFDQHQWFRIDDGHMLTPGQHVLHVRSIADGPLLIGQHHLDISAGERLFIAPDLRPIPVEVPLDLPGDGILFIAGEAIGRDDRHIFRTAGRFHLTRWNGHQAWHSTVRVGPDHIELEDWRQDPSPRGPGYLLQHINGLPVPAHHICTWQEVDWVIRSDPSLTPPLDWHRHRPLADAQGLNHRLVEAVHRTYQTLGLRLPEREEQQTLRTIYSTGLWHLIDGSVDHGGSVAASAALLVLVPDNTTASSSAP